MIHISPPQEPRIRHSLPRLSSCPKALHPTAAATVKPHKGPTSCHWFLKCCLLLCHSPLKSVLHACHSKFGHVCCSCCHGTALMLCTPTLPVQAHLLETYMQLSPEFWGRQVMFVCNLAGMVHHEVNDTLLRLCLAMVRRHSA